MSTELKSIQLKNFKCFKETPEIEFKKLTILTGANSSGKSSIIQAIVSSLQSNSFPFLYSTNGKYVTIGDFVDISHKHDKKEEIFLNFKLNSNSGELSFKTGWKLNKLNKLCQLNSLSASSNFFELNLKRKGRNYILDYDYYPEKDPEAEQEKQQIFLKLINVMSELDKKKKKNKKKEDPAELQKKYFGEIHLKDKKISIGVNSLPKTADYNLSMRFGALQSVFKDFERKTNLISSFRLHPNRTHLESSQDFTKVKKFGEGYLDQIIRWEYSNKKKMAELVGHLKKLSLLSTLETNRIGGARFDMVVTIPQNPTKVSLSDAGFGISQFLPVLVADLQMSEMSTLVVAQPEIHLHPDVQAKLGDYFIGQIEKNKKNYIIETHSECFLNRIRLGIVNGTLKEEDLAVYYIENSKGESFLHRLKFNKRGQIENAPKSFFDTYLMDLKEIATNAEL